MNLITISNKKPKIPY